MSPTSPSRYLRIGIILAWLCCASGCRFNGGSGDNGFVGPAMVESPEEQPEDTPSAPNSPSMDSATPLPTSKPPAPDSATGNPTTPDGSIATPTPTRDSGTATPPTQTPVDEDDDAATATNDCAAATRSAVCDPVANKGCAGELGMQCDVDLFATTLTGLCVFSAPAPDPASCLNIPPTETCPAKQTCVNGKCRAICVCDEQCQAGECCREKIGSGGFKLCGAC